MADGNIFGFPTLPYPAAPPRVTAPVFRGVQALEDALAGLGSGVVGAAQYAMEPVSLDEPDTVALPMNLEGVGEPPFSATPPSPQTPNLDVALQAMESQRQPNPVNTPDEAAAIFSKGATAGLPYEGALGTDWGGYATGLSQGQIDQDTRAHAAIDRRYPLAGNWDPMGEQLDATSNLRKLEAMLPAFDEGPAFEEGEGGVIRNLPKSPFTSGDVRKMEFDRSRAMLDPRMVEQNRSGKAQSDALGEIQRYTNLSNQLDAMAKARPEMAEAIAKRRADAEKLLLFKLQTLTGKSFAGFSNDDPLALLAAGQ